MESDSNQTNILMAIEETSYPTTIACVFNQIDPTTTKFKISKNHILLITIFQSEFTEASYEIYIQYP